MIQSGGAIKINRILLLILILTSFVLMNHDGPALAQTGKDPWSPPINLSNSGSTTDPVAVRDADGIIHVIWQDEIVDTMYARLEDGEWSQPVAVRYPFVQVTPQLLADERGSIHAFWINQAGTLSYTRMETTASALVAQRPRILAKTALVLDATIDSTGIIHITYISPLDAPGLPAGVYYRQSDNGGGNWTQAQLLYPSQYYRALDKEDANISIASASEGDESRVYVAWDNRPRKRIFLSMSTDGGISWSEPKAIQADNTSIASASPYGVEVGAFSDKVLLLWQSGDPTLGCRQSYQWSTDGGENWTTPSELPTEAYGCPQKNRLLPNGNLFILMTSIQDQLYLLAWDGNQWSNPEFQRTLTAFIDPETEETVLYGCQNPILLPDGQLFVVGCDGGAGGDIWVTSRPTSDTTMWFPPPSVWNPSLLVAEGNSPVSSPELIADSSGKFHAIWTQPEVLGEITASTRPKSVINYSGIEDSSWSRPVKILSSPNGDADQLSITIGVQNRLMSVWREWQSGLIYFSWANAARASTPSEWAAPYALPVVQPLVSSPMVTVSRTGMVYVVFSIPINEERGIYITTSADAGQTWSEPVRVVDAVAAGWEMVDQPQIAVSTDGHLHVMWKVFKVIGENVPLSIYYARSEDDGKSWSSPRSLVESPVYWYQMASSGDSNVHLVWQENTFREYELMQQSSTDSGRTWSRHATIVDLGTSLVPASLAGNFVDQVSLLLVAEEPVNKQVLKQWTLEGDTWSADASLDLVDDPSIRVTMLSAAIFSQGKLGVIYNLEELESAGEEADIKLLYSEREVKPSTVLLTPVATQVSQVVMTPTPAETETTMISPEPTLTITPTPIPLAQQTTVPGGPNRNLILGIALIILVIAIVSGLSAWILLKQRSLVKPSTK